jgi:hypothetical protein
MNLLLKLDQTMLGLFQRAYDYVWDRWGVLVGTFRASLPGFAFMIDVTGTYIITGMDFGALVATVVYVMILIPLLWFLYIRDHLNHDNPLQIEGLYFILNATAFFYQERPGRVMRSVMCIAFIGITLMFSATALMMLQRACSSFVLLLWCWSLGVMVRDRDTERFQEPVENLSLEGA